MLSWYLSLQWWQQGLCWANLLVFGEAIYQLIPLYKYNIPIASRTSYIFAIAKYLIGVILNLCGGMWPMSLWLAIGLTKEVLGWWKLTEIKNDELAWKRRLK
jgi:hypothetical protein